jgi:hypothetical protein
MNRNFNRNIRKSRQIRRPIQKYIPNHHQDPPVSIIVARLRQKIQGKIFFNRFNTIYNDYQYILNIYPELN